VLAKAAPQIKNGHSLCFDPAAVRTWVADGGAAPVVKRKRKGQSEPAGAS
jgi:hypothetical protein